MSEISNVQPISNEDALAWLVSVIDAVQVQGTLEQVERTIRLGKHARVLVNDLLDRTTPLEEVK